MNDYLRTDCWKHFSDKDLDTLRWVFAETTPDPDASAMLREVAFEQVVRTGTRPDKRSADFYPREWMNAIEAAEYLRCPLSRVRKLTMTGELPVHRDGRRVLYRGEELDQYVRNGGATSP